MIKEKKLERRRKRREETPDKMEDLERYTPNSEAKEIPPPSEPTPMEKSPSPTSPAMSHHSSYTNGTSSPGKPTPPSQPDKVSKPIDRSPEKASQGDGKGVGRGYQGKCTNVVLLLDQRRRRWANFKQHRYMPAPCILGRRGMWLYFAKKF